MATKQTTAQLKIQINGKEIENTFSAIRKEVTHLERDLKKLPPGTEAFMQKADIFLLLSATILPVLGLRNEKYTYQRLVISPLAS